ncbi:EAL domain-containing protein [Permianibacter sp. IMCC34836]|uniref:EAL domain-containing protein n=1 Tax=Permianibacter fluminis TaxID=2738515 RepID=UPI0015529752|nr:EAL domain-containing protein [Permianibacter fluminis]NQD36735.1 EAL domain-containing protein [Permianibacter fluminis]
MVKRVAALALTVGLVASIAPALISLYLANSQSIKEEQHYAEVLATEVLRRSDESSRQIIAAIDTLQNLDPAHPCSAVNLKAMADIDSASPYLQTVGHVRNNYLECSAYGLHGERFPVGAPDYISGNGYATRINVELPPGSGHFYAMSEKGGFAAVVHRGLSTEVFVDDPGIALGSFARSSKKTLLSRGPFDARWIDRLGERERVAFWGGDYTVAIIRSTVGDYASYAAIPARQLALRQQQLALRMVPIGVLCGLVLALIIWRLAVAQSSMPNQIRAALRRNEFFLQYQPLVELQSGRWVGAEALIRWRRSDGEWVRPDVFIPVAEESDLILRLTERVLQLAGNDMKPVFARYPEFHVAINVSAKDIESPQLLPALGNLLQDGAAEPHNIVIEATERGFLDAEVARSRVTALRAMGCKVAIDDFGTGYSSLAYLEKFAVDYLKIDKSFVDTLGTDAPTSQVVRHIIEMAKSLNYLMIAEGVETGEQASFLRAHGVQYAQGWLFAKPMAVSDLLNQLATKA